MILKKMSASLFVQLSFVIGLISSPQLVDNSNGLQGSHVIYVIPTTPAMDTAAESSLCPKNQCHTLSEFSLRHNLSSHTNIVLLPGTHTIAGNETESAFHMENVRNVSITGWNSTNSTSDIPKIVCLYPGTFQIHLRHITGLKLTGLEITGCSTNDSTESEGVFHVADSFGASINIVKSSDITIKGLKVYDGKRVGLLMLKVYHNVAILHSEFSNNGANCYLRSTGIGEDIQLTIIASIFKFGKGNNVQTTASGLQITIATRVLYVFSIQLINVTLSENHAHNGNLDMTLSATLYATTNIKTLIVRIQGLNSTHTKNGNWSNISSTHNDFTRNCAMRLKIEGGIKVHISKSYVSGSCIGVFGTKKFDQIIHLQDIQIKDGQCENGVLKLTGVESAILENILVTNSTKMLDIITSNISFQGQTHFVGNRGGMLVYGPSIVTFSSGSETTFVNNTYSGIHLTTLAVESSKIVFQNNSWILVKNNTGKTCGGITLNRSMMHVLGNITMVFDRNTGANGGAISLYSGSQVLFCIGEGISTWKNHYQCISSPLAVTVTFTENHASRKGGAIYVDNSEYMNPYTHHQRYPIELAGSLLSANHAVNIRFSFINNTADIAGCAIYGGWIVSHIPEIFDFTGQKHDHSIIASNPVRVCICIYSIPVCNITEYTTSTYPGRKVNIKAVAVGERYGMVPSIVHARLINNSNSTLNAGQYFQTVHRYCTSLNYTVLSVNEAETIELTVEKQGVPDLSRIVKAYFDESGSLTDTTIALLMQQLAITVTFEDCPAGFSFNYTLKKCSCHPTLLEHRIYDCDIESLKVFKPSQKWINATFTENRNTSSGVIVHDHCPFDYCNQNTSHISLDMDHPNDQCDFNRSGILCGACQTNFSHVFGTSRCKKCSNLWALLLVPAIALLGIALVILLISLNLTVSIGMINGLIFYANIVRANTAIFFTSNTFLSKFVAWLNLDFGFEVCFYNGLDAYTKTWLQLLFPVYIWALVSTIIILSHHYTFAARLSGSNAVQVLAIYTVPALLCKTHPNCNHDTSTHHARVP